MISYLLWTDVFGNEMVEIFNESDILRVQKEFNDKGYIVTSLIYGGNRIFMTLRKEVLEDVKD